MDTLNQLSSFLLAQELEGGAKMSSPFNRIGKSLLKYLKPVRVALPHYRPQDPGLPTDQGSTDLSDPKQDGFKLLKFKNPKEQKLKDPPIAQPQLSTEAEVPEAPLPAGKSPAHWIELVIYLLSACKKASGAMKKRMGVETYKKALQARGQTKIRTLGSIINTTTVDVDLSTSKKDRAA